jgi:hypothetical protein
MTPKQSPLDWLKSRAHGACFWALWLGIQISRPFLALYLSTQKNRAKRSLWAGTPIITLAICARAERTLGIEADSLVYTTYFTTNDFTFNLSRWNRGPFPWTRILLPYLVLMWACLRYDRFHFFFDQGILPSRDRCINMDELRLLHWLGKEVYFYAYGADVRTRERTQALGEPNCCTECPDPGRACICDTTVANAVRRAQAELATATFSMGDMIHYTDGSRNDLHYWPIDLDAEGGARYAPCYLDSGERPLRIVHAPNHRGFKGTHFLIEAVERLQAAGEAIELVLVERVPNRQALDIYRSADIIFDQCLIGFHGYFALEALAMGKPVMVFIRDPDTYLANAAECPFVNTPVSMIETNLRMLMRNRGLLRKLGERGRLYIEKYYSFSAFAARLAQVYKDVDNKVGVKMPRLPMPRASAA